MTTVDAACAKGWRHIYFNANTFRYWGVYMLAIVGIAVLGWSWLGLALALVLYVPRVFFITGVYHRYFSHRSYKTSRWFQLVLAICAQTTMQRGVLYWAANHRLHHKLSDQPGDPHSPRSGFWWAHLGWILAGDGVGAASGTLRVCAASLGLGWWDRGGGPRVAGGAVVFSAAGGCLLVVGGLAAGAVLGGPPATPTPGWAHRGAPRRYATGD